MARLIVFRRGCACRESLSALAICTKADRGRRLTCAGGTLRSVVRVVLASTGSPPMPRAYQTSRLYTSAHLGVLFKRLARCPRARHASCAHLSRPGSDYPSANHAGSDCLTKPACFADSFPAPQGLCSDAELRPVPPSSTAHRDAPTHRRETCKSSSCDHLDASQCASG